MAKRGEAWFDEDGRPICGARTSRRAGRPCRRSPAKGRLRCRIHGGNAPGAPRGNTYAKKHGYFSAVLTPDEERLAGLIKHGDLSDLIELEHIRLDRALDRERQQRADPNAACEPDGEDPGPDRGGSALAPTGDAPPRVVERPRNQRDWWAEASRCMRRIKDLEMARRAITGTGRSPEEIGEAIRDTLGAAFELLGPGMPGQQPPGAGEDAADGDGVTGVMDPADGHR